MDLFNKIKKIFTVKIFFVNFILIKFFLDLKLILLKSLKIKIFGLFKTRLH